MEEIYIGTKIVAAEPMDERDFVFSKGHTWDESQPNRPGYKVRYGDGYIDGYISWFPKETFERVYRKLTVDELVMMATVGMPERRELPFELRDRTSQDDSENVKPQ